MPESDQPADFRDREVAYWRARTEAAEERLRVAATFYPDVPPEPPVGTEYLQDGKVGWRRTDDGWYCVRIACPSCPTEWPEVWDRDLSRGTYTRRVPASLDRDNVSPRRDVQP